jgi:hypothetical protein
LTSVFRSAIACAVLVSAFAGLSARPAAAQSQASSVTLYPAAVTGGQSSTATITLSAPAPAAGAVVALTTNSTAAWVPTFVGIAPGLSSTTVNVVTFQTSATVNATISASYGGATASAVLTIFPSVAQADTVSASAQYDARKRQLKVDARSTSASAVLSVYVTATGELIGTLSNNRGRYQGTFSWPVNPGSITVKSTLGGSATVNVSGK